MPKDVQVIPATCPQDGSPTHTRPLRVAAYCRVSTDEERQLDSFENQCAHYQRFIAENATWQLAGIYSDEGISGCSTRSRPGFQAMIAACEAGAIDLVITKSISRFARNTQDSLTYTRRLRDRGVGVLFEKEGINTLDTSGELLLTLFSCFAQEESRSISENTAWGIRSRFQQGIPHLNAGVLLGYDKDASGQLVVNEAQAETVRLVYRLFLEGWSLAGIASELNRRELPGVHGQPNWCATTVGRMLENEKYAGALLMQKTFTANYLTRSSVRNTGQLAQYYVAHNHEAIIEPWLWEATQEEIARRRRFREEHGLRGLSGGGGSDSAFYAKLFCERCGTKLQRCFGKGVRKPVWRCASCGARVTDDALRTAFAEGFNGIVARRAELLPRWQERASSGTPLQRLRAEQIARITALGPIRYEVPELTRAILQEGWLAESGRLRFVLLSGESIG